MRRTNNYELQKRDAPKNVTLPNGRTFYARYEKVYGSRGKRRGQRDHELISTFKK